MDRRVSEVQEHGGVKHLNMERKLGLDVDFLHGRKGSSSSTSRPSADVTDTGLLPTQAKVGSMLAPLLWERYGL